MDASSRIYMRSQVSQLPLVDTGPGVPRSDSVVRVHLSPCADVQMGKGIDVISVVSTVPALISSNRDRRRANIVALALS